MHQRRADIDWSDGSEAAPETHRANCDVTDEEAVRACVADIEKRHGPVDILVNNAAIASLITPIRFEEIGADDWTRMLVHNTLAPFLCCKAVAPRMREQSWGRIINLTTAGIFFGLPNMLHNVASKGAVAVMTRRLMHNPAFDDGLIAKSVDVQTIPVRERPEDLVGACLYLASDAAGMMTGQILTVDGGTAFH